MKLTTECHFLNGDEQTKIIAKLGQFKFLSEIWNTVYSMYRLNFLSLVMNVMVTNEDNVRSNEFEEIRTFVTDFKTCKLLLLLL